jgi:hypothetical protein
MRHVIASRRLSAAIDNAPTELAHIGKQFFLGDETGGPCRDMDDADILSELDNGRFVWIVAPGKYIDAMAALCELLGNVSDINILATAVSTSQCRYGRGVLANEGDSIGSCHGLDLRVNVIAHVAMLVPV